MLRHLALAAAGLLALPAIAAADDTRFEGYMIITSAQNCGDYHPGSEGVSTFYPHSVGTNSNEESITFFSHFHEAEALAMADGLGFTTALKPAQGTSIGTNGWTYPAAVAITYKSPTTIGTTTQFVLLRGTIRNPRNDHQGSLPQCLVTFRAAYVRQYP